MNLEPSNPASVAPPAASPSGTEPIKPGAEPLYPQAEPYVEPPYQPLSAEAAHEGPPRRWRLMPRSLAGRLVAGVTVLVFVLVTATAAATYYSIKSFLYDRIDQQLTPVAVSNERVIEGCFFTGENFCAGLSTAGPGFRPAQPAWVAVLDSAGREHLEPPSPSSVVRLMQLTTDQALALLNASDDPHNIRTQDGQGLRVLVETFSTSGGTIAVVTGLSIADTQRTLHDVIRAELVIGAAAILFAFLASSYGVRFSLRPLYRITGTARRVASELSPEGTGLDRRVPAGEPGTEVGQLADSMNRLLSAVEEQFAARVASEQRMRQFLADASHELRTPLTSIRGYAELARMQQASGAETDYPGSLRRIESEGTRMSRLVEDLLTLARNDNSAAADGGPAREPVDMADVVHDAVEGARAGYPDRPITMSASNGLRVLGDQDSLLRAVRNLVTNAAVHTRPGGPISVTAVLNGDQVLVQVRDSGPGLPPEQSAHVFERFWRADKARSRASGGSGLGLAIVASIVTAHGGTVRFDSTVETGSTVSLRLPEIR